MEVDFLSNLSTAISGTDSLHPHLPTDEDLTDLPPMTPDKFDSSFQPWGDYIFGIVMILVGEYRCPLFFIVLLPIINVVSNMWFTSCVIHRIACHYLLRSETTDSMIGS